MTAHQHPAPVPAAARLRAERRAAAHRPIRWTPLAHRIAARGRDWALAITVGGLWVALVAWMVTQ